MAPEVWKGKISQNSDQYSLAMTYIELRLGRPPFPVTDMVTMMEGHLRKQPDLAPLDQAEQRVILKAVNKDADQRYGSCREFGEALARAVMGETVTDVRATLTSLDPRLLRSPLRTWISRCLWLLMACVLGLLIAVAAYRLNLIGPGPAPVFLLAGAEKLSDEVVEDSNGRRFFKQIACYLPGDTEPIEFLAIAKKEKDDPDTFYMMKNKVSVALYRRFSKANANSISHKDWNELNLSDDYPAFGIGVEDAHRFAEQLHGRLPTRQQWDKAAGRYEPGDREGPYNGKWTKESKLNIAVDSPMRIAEAKDDESPFGCRDMAGNGQEWTRDCNKGVVPLPPDQQPGATVYLRGVGLGYRDSAPLRYKDLEKEDLGIWDYPKNNQDIGFRVVIEP